MAATFVAQAAGHTEPGLQADWHFIICINSLREQARGLNQGLVAQIQLPSGALLTVR